MSNVRVTCGTVVNMFPVPGAIANGNGAAIYKNSPKATFQGIVTGSGAVTGTFTIQGSNDGITWCSTVLGTITLTGTAPVSDGFTTDAPWKYVRAVIASLTGTGATAQVLMGT